MNKKNNKIGDLNIKELLALQVITQKYPRLYSWDNEQVETLILDIEEAFKQNKNYLILHEDKSYSSINIVDRQRRVTTLSLVLTSSFKRSKSYV